MLLRLLSFSFLIIFLFVSCKEEDLPNPDPPGEGDASYTQYGDPMEDVPGNDEIVMYEINLRAFSETGDLQGVIDRLDELESFGVKVIWLMPIHPIGEVNSVNSPYSVKNYLKVSGEYGNLEKLRELTDEAHLRGMAVIMDWVANHTAWDHEWMQNKNWYTQDGDGNVVHPPGTNWLDVADLNFENLQMREAMIDAMKYWILEANIDGYRCDYADGVPADFWKQAFDTLAQIPDRELILLAEGSRSNHFNSGFDMTFGWEFYNALKSAFNGQSVANIYNAHINEINGVPDRKGILRFTTNHDESAWDKTPMVLFGGKNGALAATAITLFTGGVPLNFTGQEVGTIENVPFFTNQPIDWSANQDMLELYRQMYEVYNQNEVARIGNNTYFPSTNIYCLQKKYNGSEFLLIVNSRDSDVNYILPVDVHNSSWSNAISGNEEELNVVLPLESFQTKILIR